MERLDQALELLKENEPKNQSIINYIENNPIYSVEIVGKSVLVRGLSDQAWIYINGDSKEEVKELLKKINKEDKFFAAIEHWMVPYIVAGRKVVWDIDTVRYILPEHVELPTTPHQVLPLSPKDSEVIYCHSIYSKYINENYVKDRIYKGLTAGAYENDKLVAWVLTQDDGAVAFLYVDQEHRRKGYANSVVLALLGKIRKTGRQPFMYIEENNEETKQLAANLGFEVESNVYWLHLT